MGGEAVMAIDAQGWVTAANRAALALLDAETGSIGTLLGPLASSGMPMPAVGGPVVESTELQLRSMPDRWLELTIISTAGLPESRIAIIRDVTLTRRDETIGEMIPTLLSHELRTPMTSIYAAAQILHADGGQPLDERSMELVEGLSVEMRRLQLLIDDLTVLCQADGTLGLTLEPELAHRLLPEIMTRQRHRWDDVDIEFRVASEPGVTVIDRHALEHLMSDLIANAVHHGAYGAVTVTLSLDDRGGASVAVSDQGPGDSDADQQLLRPIGFARLAGETGRSAISLHVAYRLVSAMGGQIWTNRSAAGGEVGFWLPPIEASGADDADQAIDEMTETQV